MTNHLFNLESREKRANRGVKLLGQFFLFVAIAACAVGQQTRQPIIYSYRPYS